MYIPPNFHLETEHLDTLLKQLPSPYILVGDFNGHNILWGCKDNSPKGNIIEDFITKNDLCLMNDKSHTYLQPATGKFSSLNLSICHPSLLLDFDWTVSENQHGSDSFPVIESVGNSTNNHNAKWKPNKANWDDDDEFRFNDTSTHEGHLRQNAELTWFCNQTIIMISHKRIKCKTRTNLKIKAVILC